jgi:uracil-DNA glycosylase family 4
MNKSVQNHQDNWLFLNEQISACRLCPRLVAWRESVAVAKKKAYQDRDYWGKPVPGFGDRQARILVVGLAPGAHGSNRTGRMFTGDSSGIFLYNALHRAGFASQPTSTDRTDSLTLTGIFITAVGRCAPPENKPAPQELLNCQPYLLREIELLPQLEGVVALGRISYDRLLHIFYPSMQTYTSLPFSHGAFYAPEKGKPWILASYHPSRQNTQTGRLTPAMFDQIWQRAAELLSTSAPEC